MYSMKMLMNGFNVAQKNTLTAGCMVVCKQFVDKQGDDKMIEKKYILEAYYQAYVKSGYERKLAKFIVTNPTIGVGGIWATSQTAWGGKTRHFYDNRDIVSFREDN